MSRRSIFLFILCLALLILAFALNLLLGSVNIPFSSIWNIISTGDDANIVWKNIIWKSRIPQAVMALAAGAALAVSGLQMQTVFRNPLADPSILGVSAGASLGVAFAVLLSGAVGHVALSSLGLFGEVTVFFSAILGAFAVLFLVVFISTKVTGNVTLLLLGVMIGYVANAIIGVLKFFSSEEDVRAYVVWGFGSFARASGHEPWTFLVIILCLLPFTFLLAKSMNIMLLGDSYAKNLGLNIRRTRFLVILCSGLLVAITTAYCGPIMFLGLAVPHIARILFRTSDNRILIPASALLGSLLALTCNIIARLPGLEGALPINSVTALIGAPVVAIVLLRRQKYSFNE